MGIGWKLNRTETEAFLKSFEQETDPEKSHYQDRYSPTTGRKLKPDLIIDQEAVTDYFVDGKNAGYQPEDLLEALNQKVKGFHFEAVYPNELGGDIEIVVFLDLRPVGEESQLDCNEETYLEFFIPDHLDELFEPAAKALKELLPKEVELGFPKLIGAISIT
jgi:hypothetical protein